MSDSNRGQFIKENDLKTRCNALANDILPAWITIMVMSTNILIKEKSKMSGYEVGKQIKEYFNSAGANDAMSNATSNVGD